MVANERTRAALDRLAIRFGLNERQREQLAMVLAVLGANEQAPTAVRTAERAVDVHLADSLAALELDATAAARRIADLGSGAGFPGLVLAVALPGAEVRLLESRRRSCEYLEDVCARAQIANARVVRARVEEWHDGSSGHDLVVARALGPQPVALEYAAPLLRVGGRLVDWRGRRDSQEEARSMTAAEELGLELAEVRHVVPFEGAREHHLHVYLKVRDTPARFPRRPGIARKRPLST
jgi:16S rRNA (guanine527-N7)-methyltransferase